jgi:hypothetical protein
MSAIPTARMQARLRAALPRRWFADDGAVLDTVLAGFADSWTWVQGLLDAVRAETRITTASAATLGRAALDFFGARLPRRGLEGDEAYRTRLLAALRRSHATRPALIAALEDLTGQTPVIFEPARPADTGGYGTTALGWGMAGAWGSLSMPFQCFVTVSRPHGGGIARCAGYGTGGPLVYSSLDQAPGRILDADIMRTVAEVLPAGTVAWTRIIN